MIVLVRVIEGLVVALLAVVALTVSLEVFARNLLGLSLGVHEELTRYLMIWVAMLACPLLTHEDGHVRISILPDALPARPRGAVNVLADLVALFFLAGLVYASSTNLPSIVGQSTITLGVGMVWFHAALPVGGLLMALLTVRNLVVHIRQTMTPVQP